MNQSTAPEQFNEIVRVYGGYVYTIAFRLLGNSADAEDVAQETFIKAYKRLDTFDEQKGLRNWLCTIALNTARDYYRKSLRRSAAAEREDAEAAVADGIEYASEAGSRLDARKMLSVLDMRYRTVVMLYYMEQCSVKEIAAMVKRSESVIKVWLFRARKILVEKFGDSGI